MNELLPGRELDALVCERVFGLVRCRGEKHDASYPNTYCYAATDSPTEGAEARCYSTEINDAWEVVAAMREKYNCLLTLEQYLMNSDEYEDWGATFRHRETDTEHSSTAGLFESQTAPLAICRAALLAVGAGGASSPVPTEGINILDTPC